MNVFPLANTIPKLLLHSSPSCLLLVFARLCFSETFFILRIFTSSFGYDALPLGGWNVERVAQHNFTLYKEAILVSQIPCY